MRITFSAPAQPRAGAFVVGVLEGRKLTASAAQLDRKMDGAISRAIRSSRFKGAKEQIFELVAPSGLEVGRVVLLGLGKPEALDALVAQALGGRLAAHLRGTGEETASVAVDPVKGAKLGAPSVAANLAYGARLRSYRFDRYRTREKKEDKPSLANLRVMLRDSAAAKRLYAPMDQVAAGAFLTRDLVSEPANVLTPRSLAQQARALTRLGVKVEVLDQARMRKLGMNALLGVAQGSEQPPRLVVMRWNGTTRAKDKRPVAFVGKGVTFDSGGLSLKTAAGMEDMKWDMGGAGVVVGLMKALAGRKAKVNAVGVVGLVENMPSGKAQRPGDIVKSMSGQTIEVLNTDAEGRLVLADALWYTQNRFKPRAMINLATLTGAVIVALGNEYAGVFSNDDTLADRIVAAGQATGERIWRLPLDEAYDKLIDSDIADVKNISGGRAAGSITAAQFLQRFVDKTPWAHLDIAGVTWSKKDAPTVPKGGTGFGVRLLDRLVADHYEK